MVTALDPQQQAALKPHIRSFLRYLKTDRFRKDQEDRLRRVRYFQDELPSRLEALSEADVAALVGELWASQIWGNKQYLVQKVIEDNGLDALREELGHLLDRSVSPQARYERGVSRIRRLGPASVTEMLCYSDPARCGIWNERARGAIKRLGLESFVSPEKYRLSGTEYATLNALLDAIGRELAAAGMPDIDLLMVDFFLYEVSAGQRLPLPAKVFDHDEVRDLIQSIGTMLGFDAQTEVRIAHGASVDVVWRARIGNLGTVTYVFEVHKSGSLDSLVLNLEKAKSSPTVQRVIAVSDEEQLQRIEKETEGLPDEFRRSLAFWPVAEVQAVSENLRTASESLNRLGLVPGT
jgi:hypothetical protein